MVKTSCKVIMNHNTQLRLASHVIEESLLLTFQEALVGGGQSNTWGQLLVRERCEQVFFLHLFSKVLLQTANEC